MPIRIPFPDELPKPPSTVFSLATPQHMLMKFAWEIRQVKSSLRSPSENPFEAHVPAHHAFNCAVTGWHLTDWTWSAADQGLQADIAARFGFPLRSKDRKNLEAFCDAIAARCRELHICRWIANGSKHMALEQPDTEVQAKTEWRVWEGEPYRLLVQDGDMTRSAEDIFDGAFDYWRDILAEFGFVEPRLIFNDEEQA